MRAREAVILAAGATQSPKLLQLSGIGPGALLAQFGITPVRDMPGVGENLRDHYSPRLVARVAGVDSLNRRARGLRLLREIGRWLRGKPSILALAPALVHGFGRTDPRLETTDFSLVFAPGSYKQGFVGVLDEYDGLTCGAWQMRPESAGYVRITSADPRQLPAIMPNYLHEELDRRTLVAALKIARRVLNSKALRPYVQAEVFPGPEVQTDDEWLDFARRNGNSSYHLIGSCRMGPKSDPAAVVDANLRVHGFDGLYVIDSSVMPTVPSANTYAATLMVAEKGADLVLGRRPLEPEPQKWPRCKHDNG